jgi:hypothetical protein
MLDRSLPAGRDDRMTAFISIYSVWAGDRRKKSDLPGLRAR